MTGIKNIIFDLGGVIINLDFSLTINAFTELGASGFDDIFNPPQQARLFDQFDKGLISEQDFFLSLKQALALPQPVEELEQAWNAMLLDIPGHRLSQLQAYKQRYRTILLSNTNVSHVKSFESYLAAEHGAAKWEPYFHRVYYSCDVSLRKPDPAIFTLVLEENDLKPEETLFIDDTLINIHAARDLGMQAVHLPRGDEFGELLEGLLETTEELA